MPTDIDLLPAIDTSRAPQHQTSRHNSSSHPYVVIVYDDDWHTFVQVETQLQKATACTLEKAEALAVEIDANGRSVVFGGTQPECERVANILREIRLQVETDKA